MPTDIRPVTVENARLIYRNFRGEARRFTAAGDRNFGVLLDEETAALMEKDGWNVRILQPRVEGDLPQPMINVSVKYWKRDGTRVSRPPRVVLITSRGKTNLTEDMIAVLDYAEIEYVDLIINPREWEPGRIKAYLKAIYVTIREDELEMKYFDVPDSAAALAEAQEEVSPIL